MINEITEDKTCSTAGFIKSKMETLIIENVEKLQK